MGQTFPVALNTSQSITTVLSDTSTALQTLQSTFSGTTAPTSPAPVAGQQFFDTDTKALEVYDGTAWRSQSGRVGEDITPASSVGSGEETLQTVVIPAGLVAQNGQRVRITAAAAFGTNPTVKQHNIYFGVLSVSQIDVATGASELRIVIDVVRTGSSAQAISVSIGQTVGTTYEVRTEYLTGSVAWGSSISVESRGVGTDPGDVTARFLLVEAIL